MLLAEGFSALDVDILCGTLLSSDIPWLSDTPVSLTYNEPRKRETRVTVDQNRVTAN